MLEDHSGVLRSARSDRHEGIAETRTLESNGEGLGEERTALSTFLRESLPLLSQGCAVTYASAPHSDHVA